MREHQIAQALHRWRPVVGVARARRRPERRDVGAAVLGDRGEDGRAAAIPLGARARREVHAQLIAVRRVARGRRGRLGDRRRRGPIVARIRGVEEDPRVAEELSRVAGAQRRLGEQIARGEQPFDPIRRAGRVDVAERARGREGLVDGGGERHVVAEVREGRVVAHHGREPAEERRERIARKELQNSRGRPVNTDHVAVAGRAGEGDQERALVERRGLRQRRHHHRSRRLAVLRRVDHGAAIADDRGRRMRPPIELAEHRRPGIGGVAIGARRGVISRDRVEIGRVGGDEAALAGVEMSPVAERVRGGLRGRRRRRAGAGAHGDESAEDQRGDVRRAHDATTGNEPRIGNRRR